MLQATGIYKTFDRTQALAGATFELRSGEIHGLLGANGAGKSTLSKVISGHVQPDQGELLLDGLPITIGSTREALARGIAIVMQETSLVPDLSVLENIFLPELGRPGRLSYAGLRERGYDILRTLGQENNVSLDSGVRHLSSAQRQLVEIAKALSIGARLIIFDEPTASLSPGEVERLFEVMTRLRDTGAGLVFVSHRLEEVLEITDRVTILREGRTVLASRATETLSQAELIRQMVGQDLTAIYERKGTQRKPTSRIALEVSGLSALPLVRNVSFKVHEGEILGLGGLVGAGRSEIVESIFGLRPRSSGTIKVDGKIVNPKKPLDAIRSGIGFLAEDRRAQNIVPDFSVRENLLLAHLGAHKGFGLGYSRRDQKISEILASLGLPADRLLDANMLNFSGGMQQKIIIARWLLLEPRVLILDEPTKGVDIGTRSSIYTILRDIAAKGVAIVLVSSDFEELLGLSDRVVVISDGSSIADLDANVLDEEKLTLLAAPRTSMVRNTAMLKTLTDELGGAGFWGLIDNEQIICLNLVTKDAGADPGFVAGEAKTFEATRISAALKARDSGFVTDPSTGLSTLLVPLQSRRGHDFGWIGLSLPPHITHIAPGQLRDRIQSLANTL